jgi:hypothetical protein
MGKAANAVERTKVCPKCWGELRRHPCYDFYECRKHSVSQMELESFMLVVVYNKERRHSASIRCGDLYYDILPGQKPKGIVVYGVHGGMNWERGP